MEHPGIETAASNFAGSQKRKRRWLAFALAVLLCTMGVFLFLRGSPGLLDHSTGVPIVKDVGWYDWLSKTEMLAITSGSLRGMIFRIDTRTGLVSELNAHLSGLSVVYAFTTDGLSPNKRWLHCKGAVGRVNTHEFFTLTGAHRNYVDGPYSKDEIGEFEGAWGPDSRTWVYLHQEDASLRFGELTVEGPKRRREYRVNAGTEFHQPRIESVLRNGHVLVREGESRLNPQQTFRLFEYDLRGEKLVNKYAIALPFTVGVYGSALSPPGNRIAFLLETIDPPVGLSVWLNRLTRKPSGPVMSLWIANLDGSHLRLLGSEALRVDRINGEEAEIGCLRWLSDGKRLSFIFRDKLWTIPAD